MATLAKASLVSVACSELRGLVTFSLFVMKERWVRLFSRTASSTCKVTEVLSSNTFSSQMFDYIKDNSAKSALSLKKHLSVPPTTWQRQKNYSMTERHSCPCYLLQCLKKDYEQISQLQFML